MTRTLHFIIAAWLLVLLTGCATLPGPSTSVPEPEQAAQRVVSAYHLSHLLGRAELVLDRSLMNSLPDDVGHPARERVRRAIKQAYDTAALMDAVRRRLADQARQDDQGEALGKAAVALDSTLAKRMVGLQGEAGDDGFAKRYNAFLQAPADAHRQQRLGDIHALIDNMDIVGLQSTFQVTLLRAMLNTREQLTAGADQPNAHAAASRIERARDTLQEQLHSQVPLILLYVYRNIDDDTLQSYVRMQSSPALAWTNQALTRAVGETLADAGRQVVAAVRHDSSVNDE